MKREKSLEVSCSGVRSGASGALPLHVFPCVRPRCSWARRPLSFTVLSPHPEPRGALSLCLLTRRRYAFYPLSLSSLPLRTITPRHGPFHPEPLHPLP